MEYECSKHDDKENRHVQKVQTAKISDDKWAIGDSKQAFSLGRQLDTGMRNKAAYDM